MKRTRNCSRWLSRISSSGTYQRISNPGTALPDYSRAIEKKGRGSNRTAPPRRTGVAGLPSDDIRFSKVTLNSPGKVLTKGNKNGILLHEPGGASWELANSPIPLACEVKFSQVGGIAYHQNSICQNQISAGFAHEFPPALAGGSKNPKTFPGFSQIICPHSSRSQVWLKPIGGGISQ